MDVRLKNSKEDLYLQHELSLLSMRHRHILRTLHQETDSLVRAHRKLLLLKVCEPKATINKTMREISETRNGRMDSQDVYNSDRQRIYSSKSLSYDRRPPLPNSRRAQSGLPIPVRNTLQSAKHQEAELSILQLKQIATIDCISNKELVYQQQYIREEKERLKQSQKDTLQQKIQVFLETLDRAKHC